MDFKTITDIIFTKKRLWPEVTDDEKESLFFIFNRYMSKKYPIQANQFNHKFADKALAMDIWFLFLKNEVRVPFWFWKGPTKKKDPSIKGWQEIRSFYELPINDIHTLCEMYPADVKAEIKRLETINKEMEK